MINVALWLNYEHFTSTLYPICATVISCQETTLLGDGKIPKCQHFSKARAISILVAFFISQVLVNRVLD